jgi:reticulon-4-interacting protein 1, mitochondrial
MAEVINAPVNQMSKAPMNVSLKAAAVLPLVSLTALQAFQNDWILHPGDKVLIIGASGGVGHIAVQMAKHLNASLVACICSGRNASYVRSLGATHIVDYTNEDVIPGLIGIVRAFGKFNIVLDCVSSGSEADARFMYEERIVGHGLLNGKYLKIGGTTSDWIMAAIKRITGFNLFEDHRELVWIRFYNTANHLSSRSLAGSR